MVFDSLAQLVIVTVSVALPVLLAEIVSSAVVEKSRGFFGALFGLLYALSAGYGYLVGDFSSVRFVIWISFVLVGTLRLAFLERFSHEAAQTMEFVLERVIPIYSIAEVAMKL